MTSRGSISALMDEATDSRKLAPISFPSDARSSAEMSSRSVSLTSLIAPRTASSTCAADTDIPPQVALLAQGMQGVGGGMLLTLDAAPPLPPLAAALRAGGCESIDGARETGGCGGSCIAACMVASCELHVEAPLAGGAMVIAPGRDG